MLKKTISYTDYNNVVRTEDFYFNLTHAELAEMDLSTTGGLAETIRKIVSAQDSPSIVKLFKDLVLRAYGERSADGRRFKKTDENGEPLSRHFAETEAYSILFMELATDDESAATFINGIIPADTAQQVQQAQQVPTFIK